MNDKHYEVMRVLGNLEGKVDGINHRLDVINGSVASQEKRVRSLENDRAKVYGIATTLSVAVGVAVAWVKSKITGD